MAQATNLKQVGLSALAKIRMAKYSIPLLPVAINYNGSNAVNQHGFQAHVGSMRSPSRGRVRLKSLDPKQHPSILFNYMSSEQDWEEFRAAIRITEIMAQPALDPYRGDEISPGKQISTDEELDAFVRESRNRFSSVWNL